MIIRRVFTLFAVLLVGLAILEISFRLFVFPDWRTVSKVPFQKHAVYGTFQKPNLEVRRYNPPNYDVVNRTNSRGFRDRESGFDADLNAIWIAGLSNSYGGYVEDAQTYARLLEDKYGYRNALLASEGHVLPNQVAVMRHLHAQGYRPSLVILELTLNNVLRPYADGVRELAEPFYAPEIGEASQTRERALPGLLARVWRIWTRLLSIDFIGIKARLINNSAVYAWAKVGVNASAALRQYTGRLGLRADPAVSDNIPVDMLSAAGAKDDRLTEELADYVAGVGEWVEASLKAEFVVVLLPSPHHLNADWFDRYLASKGLGPADLDPSRPYRLVRQALEDRNVPVLGMAEPLLSVGRFLNFPDDGHLNAAGHARIARSLADWLKTRFGREPDLDP